VGAGVDPLLIDPTSAFCVLSCFHAFVSNLKKHLQLISVQKVTQNACEDSESTPDWPNSVRVLQISTTKTIDKGNHFLFLGTRFLVVQSLTSYEAFLFEQEDLAKAYARARRADDASDPIRLYNYQKHRDRVLTARPVVDCKSPIVGKTAYASPTNFNRSIAQFVHIERENARMLQRIGTIMKGPVSYFTEKL
jgi:hypothetical protein